MKHAEKKVEKAELAKRMSKKSKFTMHQSKQAIDEIMDIMTEYLASNDFFQIRGFGSFCFKKYKRHIGRLPTGEIVEKERPYYVKFNPGKYLRDSVKKNGENK